MMGSIYRIRNIENGKVYVGKTNGQLLNRWRRHIQESRQGTRSRFYNAMRKYGERAFEISLIETVPSEELANAERKWIQRLKSRDPNFGYNITGR